MGKKRIRTVLIAALVLAFLGVSLSRLTIEPPDPPADRDLAGTADPDAHMDSGPPPSASLQTASPARPENAGQQTLLPAQPEDHGSVADGSEQTAEENTSPGETGQESHENGSGAVSETKSDDTAPSDGDHLEEKLPPEEPERHICTLEIRCDTVVDTSKLDNQAVAPYVPADGVILGTFETEYTPGESVFDVLLRITRAQGIQMEFRDDALYSGKYIEGINYLYEFDGGPLSGWMYKVNGQFPNHGCAAYTIADNDEIVWMYTCDLGVDVGDNSVW